MDLNYDGVPPILKMTNQWILWSNDNGTKIPRRADGKGNARTNDRSTFSTFDECVAALKADLIGEYAGLAFVITREDNFVGVDLDACLACDDEDLTLTEWAKPIVASLRGVSYGERSPSGNGVKFLTHGSKVPGSRCVKSFDGNKEQIEVYEHSRFWAITGDCVGPFYSSVGDGSKQIDLICHEYLSPSQPAVKSSAVHAPAAATQFSTDVDLLYRAERYIEQSGGTQSGGRNNAAFAVSGHLRSLRDMNGHGLPEDVLMELMRRWNATLGEPISDSELVKASRSSSRNGTPRAEKGPEEVILPSRSGEYSRLSDETDITQFLRSVKAGVDEENSIPAECLEVGGLIGDIMAYNKATARYWQPEMALGAAISLVSLMIGRRFIDSWGTRGNIYIVSLAPSGSGKDHARKVNKEIVTEVFSGEDSPLARCPDGIASDVGLLRLATDGERLLQLDEAAKFMSVATKSSGSPWLRKIPGLLLRLFTSSDSSISTDELADRERSVNILNPYLTVYATSTGSGWWNSLDEETLTDGLLARLVIIEAKDKYPDLNVNKANHGPPEDLVGRLRAWAMHGQLEGDLTELIEEDPSRREYDIKEVDFEQDALEKFQTYQQDVRQHMRDLESARERLSESKQGIWARAGEKVAKLALISACSYASPGHDFKITLRDIEWAITLVEATTRRLVAESAMRVNSCAHEKAVNDIARAITSRRGDGISKAELTKESSWVTRRARQDAIADLIESRRIEYDSDCDKYFAIAKIS